MPPIACFVHFPSEMWICAWCKVEMPGWLRADRRAQASPSAVSHGICGACLAKQLGALAPIRLAR